MDLSTRTWFYITCLILSTIRRGHCVNNVPSCTNTIAYVSHHEPDLFHIYDPDVASICGRTTQNCCKSKVEKYFRIRNYRNATTDIGKMLHTLLRDYRSYDTLTTTYAYAVEKGRERFISYFRNTFGNHHYKYTFIADALFQYLSNFTSTLNANQLPGELYSFYADLFVASSKEFLHLSHVSPGYEQCLRSVYRRFEHTGYDTLYRSLNSLLQKLQLVLRARETLGKILDHLMGDQSLLLGGNCPTSLMEMSTCQLCHGYAYHSLPPCKNLCLNTLSGCLAPVRRLTNPLLYQYRILEQLISQYSGEFKGFEDHFYILAKTTMDFVIRMSDIAHSIVEKVKNQCAIEKNGDVKRVSSSDKAKHVHSSPQQYPISAPTLDLSSDLEQFLISHNRVVTFLLNLPAKFCHKLGAATVNSHCWNGKEKGKYRVELFNSSISQQLNNPTVSHTPDSFLSYEMDYQRIKDVTYSIQDVVQVKACYDDDLRCYSSLPRCSGSEPELGSGMSGDGTFDSEEMGGEDLSYSEEESDQLVSYSGDFNYEIQDRSIKNTMFYKIARRMSHTVKTCLPPQYVFPPINTRKIPPINTRKIPPITEPTDLYYLNQTEFNTTLDVGSAGAKNSCIIFLLWMCLCLLMSL